MWVGTELATRLRAAPGRAEQVSASSVGAAANNLAASPSTAGETQAPAAITGPVRATWQAPAEVKVGDTFTVNLNLASGTPLRGAPLEIAFSAQTFDVVEVSEGAFFKQAEGATSFTQAVNTGTGRIGVGVLRNDATGATGQTTMLTHAA